MERKSTRNHDAAHTKLTDVDVSKSLFWTSVHTFSAVIELQGEPGLIREEYQRLLRTLPPNMTCTPVLSGFSLSLENSWTNCRSPWLKVVRSYPVSDSQHFAVFHHLGAKQGLFLYYSYLRTIDEFQVTISMLPILFYSESWHARHRLPGKHVQMLHAKTNLLRHAHSVRFREVKCVYICSLFTIIQNHFKSHMLELMLIVIVSFLKLLEIGMHSLHLLYPLLNLLRIASLDSHH